MKTLKLWRTFKEGGKNFRRNGWLSFATVSILTFSLFIVGFSFLLGVTTKLMLENMREKVNMIVSFNPDVPEERILQIRDELSKYTKEIASVEYISRDEALSQFLAENKHDPIIVQAVEEIGENPLLPSLTIKAVHPEDYALIDQEIKNSTFQNDVSRTNFDKNERVFNRVEKINRTTERAGLFLGAIFIFIAVLITFNTIRITIYSHRQEFEIMRLVGASNLYVRTPFLFEGAFYGITAAVVTMVLLFAAARAIAPLTEGAIPQGNFTDLYLQNFVFTFIGLLLLGVFLGVISSIIAIRRYLKV